MNAQALNKANIDNLTRLWKNYGHRAVSAGVYASLSWPHRCWVDWDADTRLRPGCDEFFATLPAHSTIPIWEDAWGDAQRLEQTLAECGFATAFEQTAMYLPLHGQAVAAQSCVVIERIQAPGDIQTWARICGLAFGYEIDVSVIFNIADNPNIRLYLAYCDGQAAATAMLYKTADIVGIHQVGVAPGQQGKGLAQSLMRYVIHVAAAWRGRYITLQASAAGERLYHRLGFKRQFIIRNYQRKSRE